jgi:hypothetical protein
LITNEKLLSGLQAIVDSGTSVNLLPYKIGLALGLEWDNPVFPNIGKVRGHDCLGVILGLGLEGFEALPLRFAWSPESNIPLLLGQVNFFQHFRICFDAEEEFFTLERKHNT